MKRLTLHIGSHKTGTTTVQATLVHNDMLLRERGLEVVRGDTAPHLHQYLGYSDHRQIVPMGFSLHDPEKFAAILSANDALHVFGSSENFSFFFDPHAIEEMASALRRRFDDIRIIVYLRRQDRHTVSHHQEGAKPARRPEGQIWGHAPKALPDAAAAQAYYLDYNHRIGLWEAAFGREALMVRLFDRRLLIDGDIVPDILALLGVDPAGLERLPDRNVSLDRIRAKVCHIANAVEDNDRLTDQLIRGLPTGAERMMPDRAAARAFLEPYRHSNRLLNERLKISAYPDLFPDDFDDYPEVATDGWVEDEANAAIGSLISMLAQSQTPAAQGLTADDLRMAALALQHEAPQSALRLVRAALKLRPKGQLLNKLRVDLEGRVAKMEPEQI